MLIKPIISNNTFEDIIIKDTSFWIKLCIEIISCEFKRKKAKRHGGALSIRTWKSVLIRDCEFESNVANNENNSSELLFTNHYDWKNKGFDGAIYLNPTFRTDDGNGYCMKNVTITNCIFRMNRAYQGYAIYIEDENWETTFSINDNNQFMLAYSVFLISSQKLVNSAILIHSLAQANLVNLFAFHKRLNH